MTTFQSPIRRFQVDLEGDGKFTEFKMALNYDALVMLCDKWEVPLEKIDTILNHMNAQRIRDVVFCAMKSLDEKVTEATVAPFIKALSVPDLTKAVSELITSSSPPPPDAKAPARHPQKPPKKRTR